MKKRFYETDKSTAKIADHADVWMDEDDLHSLEDRVMPGTIDAELLEGMYADATRQVTYIDADYYDTKFRSVLDDPIIYSIDEDFNEDFFVKINLIEKVCESYQIFDKCFR